MRINKLKLKYGITDNDVDIIHKELVHNGSLRLATKKISVTLDEKKVYIIAKEICSNEYQSTVSEINEVFHKERLKIQSVDFEKIEEDKELIRQKRVIKSIDDDVSVSILVKTVSDM